MVDESAEMGERRRRRAAERAVESTGQGERPLTRRELRARDEALATGALELGDTGELRAVPQPAGTTPDAPPEPRPEAGGDEVRESSPAESSPSSASSSTTEGAPLTRREMRRRAGLEDTSTGSIPAQQTPAGQAPTTPPAPASPWGGAGTSGVRAPQPVVRRPVVRPAVPPRPEPAPAVTSDPVSTGGDGAARWSAAALPEAPAPDPVAAERGTTDALVPGDVPVPGGVPATGDERADDVALADDGADGGAHETDVERPVWRPVTAAYAADATETVDEPGSPRATAAAPVSDGAPLPSTRRTRLAAAAEVAVAPRAHPAPSLDAVINGEAQEPDPFPARPAWAELTPAEPMPAIAPPERPTPGPAVAALDGADRQETVTVPAVTGPPPPPAAAPASLDDHDADDEDDDEDDDHSTPRWLVLLMWLVALVAAVVLALLLWRAAEGDLGVAGAVAATALTTIGPAGG